MNELIDVLVSIDIHLQLLGWTTVSRDGDDRIVTFTNDVVIKWAIAVLEHSGMKSEQIWQRLEGRSPQGQWLMLRRSLPDRALHTLNKKLMETWHEQKTSQWEQCPPVAETARPV